MLNLSKIFIKFLFFVLRYLMTFRNTADKTYINGEIELLAKDIVVNIVSPELPSESKSVKIIILENRCYIEDKLKLHFTDDEIEIIKENSYVINDVLCAKNIKADDISKCIKVNLNLRVHFNDMLNLTSSFDTEFIQSFNSKHNCNLDILSIRNILCEFFEKVLENDYENQLRLEEDSSKIYHFFCFNFNDQLLPITVNVLNEEINTDYGVCEKKNKSSPQMKDCDTGNFEKRLNDIKIHSTDTNRRSSTVTTISTEVDKQELHDTEISNMSQIYLRDKGSPNSADAFNDNNIIEKNERREQSELGQEISKDPVIKMNIKKMENEVTHFSLISHKESQKVSRQHKVTKFRSYSLLAGTNGESLLCSYNNRDTSSVLVDSKREGGHNVVDPFDSTVSDCLRDDSDKRIFEGKSDSVSKTDIVEGNMLLNKTCFGGVYGLDTPHNIIYNLNSNEFKTINPHEQNDNVRSQEQTNKYNSGRDTSYSKTNSTQLQSKPKIESDSKNDSVKSQTEVEIERENKNTRPVLELEHDNTSYKGEDRSRVTYDSQYFSPIVGLDKDFSVDYSFPSHSIDHMAESDMNDKISSSPFDPHQKELKYLGELGVNEIERHRVTLEVRNKYINFSSDDENEQINRKKHKRKNNIKNVDYAKDKDIILNPDYRCAFFKYYYPPLEDRKHRTIFVNSDSETSSFTTDSDAPSHCGHARQVSSKFLDQNEESDEFDFEEKDKLRRLRLIREEKKRNELRERKLTKASESAMLFNLKQSLMRNDGPKLHRDYKMEPKEENKDMYKKRFPPQSSVPPDPNSRFLRGFIGVEENEKVPVKYKKLGFRDDSRRGENISKINNTHRRR